MPDEFLFPDEDLQPKRFERKADFFAPAPGEKQPSGTPAPAPTTATTPKAPQAPATPKVYSVTQLTRLIKFTLAAQLPGKILVEGEITECRQHSSGHIYLKLKDENSILSGVIWKSDAARLKFRLEDGLSVIATGRIDVFERSGSYQMYIEKLEPSGLGRFLLAFNQLKDKLQQEGLFDTARKKPLPRFPRTLAIVTSAEGEAIKDIGKILRQRWPFVRKLLYPVAVQGPTAAPEIAAALGALNRRAAEFGGIDLMIVGRGGGSLEDLWAFNEEVVARAIFTSKIPVISAVGHEGDVTISDLVADLRAPTPTAGAMLAVPDRRELLQQVANLAQRLAYCQQQHARRGREQLNTLAYRPLFARPLDLVRYKQQALDQLEADLCRFVLERWRAADRRVRAGAEILRKIEPHIAMHHARSVIFERQQRLHHAQRDLLAAQRHGLENLRVRLEAARPTRRIAQENVRLGHAAQRLAQAREQFLWRHRQRLEGLSGRLANLDPRGVLARGYSITRDAAGRIVTPAAELKKADIIITELAGRVRLESAVTRPPEKEPHG